MDYSELVKRIHSQAVYLPEKFSKNAELLDVLMKAADAIEELSVLCANQSKDCSEAVAKYLELWEKQPRWIPVAERLPEENVCVLVLGGYFAKVMETAILDDGLFYSAWDNRTEMFGVTHWMPLPQLPKEEA